MEETPKPPSKPRRSSPPRRARGTSSAPRPSPRPTSPHAVGEKESPTFRARIRRDPFLFALCVGFLGFTTSALAVSWRLLGDPLLLALTVLSLVPAFYLFYLRDDDQDSAAA